MHCQVDAVSGRTHWSVQHVVYGTHDLTLPKHAGLTVPYNKLKFSWQSLLLNELLGLICCQEEMKNLPYCNQCVN